MNKTSCAFIDLDPEEGQMGQLGGSRWKIHSQKTLWNAQGDSNKAGRREFTKEQLSFHFQTSDFETGVIGFSSFPAPRVNPLWPCFPQDRCCRITGSKP